MEVTLPPMNPEPISIGWTVAVNVIVVAVWTTETSLEIKLALYCGWLMMALDVWASPPLFKKMVPTTTTVLANVRPTVQWAAERTHLLLIIEPPQKWKFPADLKETWKGNWPVPAFWPPTIRSCQLASKSAAVIK